MQEGIVMDMFKLVITSFTIVTLMAVFQLFLSIGNVNDYKQFVNVQIERNGGLTAAAMEKISRYNADECAGQFSLAGADNQKHPYGSEIDYTINGQVKIAVFSIPDMKFSVRGSAVSLIRGESN